jgi:hypothetical protein
MYDVPKIANAFGAKNYPDKLFFTAVQVFVGLSLIHGPPFSGDFITIEISGFGSLVPRPARNLEDQGL